MPGKIILKLILKKRDGSLWTGVIWLMIGTGGGTWKARIKFWGLENVELVIEDLLDCATYS